MPHIYARSPYLSREFFGGWFGGKDLLAVLRYPEARRQLPSSSLAVPIGGNCPAESRPKNGALPLHWISYRWNFNSGAHAKVSGNF